MKMDHEKVKDIIEWPFPRNVYEVGSFHGLESFYRMFIKNFSNICAPIVEIIKRHDKPFECKEATKRGFTILKYKLKKNTILTLPNFKKLFKFKCDVSGLAIGVVLRQEKKPIAYFSDNMNGAMKKYSSHDREFCVLIQEL